MSPQMDNINLSSHMTVTSPTISLHNNLSPNSSTFTPMPAVAAAAAAHHPYHHHHHHHHQQQQHHDPFFLPPSHVVNNMGQIGLSPSLPNFQYSQISNSANPAAAAGIFYPYSSDREHSDKVDLRRFKRFHHFLII